MDPIPPNETEVKALPFNGKIVIPGPARAPE